MCLVPTDGVQLPPFQFPLHAYNLDLELRLEQS